MKPKKAGIILKTIERCNINCTYCYYFNKADQSWRNRKPHISMEMIDKFNDLISQGIKDLSITDLLVEFHGGAPLLQKKHYCYLSEEGCPSSLDFKTVRETFASYGFSLAWCFSCILLCKLS